MRPPPLFLLIYWGLRRGDAQAPSPFDYPSRVPGTCPSLSQYDCGFTNCVDFSVVRNCVNDCVNGEDEQCGSHQVKCDEALTGDGCGQCVPRSAEFSLCIDRRFESLCNTTGALACPGTRNCVLGAWLDDGEDDCGDGWDEDGCRDTHCGVGGKCVVNPATREASCNCPAESPDCEITNWGDERIPGKCASNPAEWDCGEKCIPFTAVLDCNRDCDDGSDEQCPTGLELCSDQCTCRPPAKVDTCPVEGQQQPNLCTKIGSVKCIRNPNMCLPAEFYLDKENDCGDWSDEDACLHPELDSCSPNAICASNPQAGTFNCTCKPGFTGSGKTCNDAATLPGGGSTTPGPFASTTVGGISEPNLTDYSSLFCKPWANPVQINCGGGVCIDARFWRDCKKDCDSGIDEECGPGQVKCDDCKCVPPDKRFTSCVEYRRCAPGEFKCGTGSCIVDELVFDGTWDCLDGSDESCTRLGCPSTDPCAFHIQQSNFTCGCPSLTERDNRGICRPSSGLVRDCAAILLETRDRAASGPQTVYRPGCLSPQACAFQVLCDQVTEGGGWTVIQQRQGAFNFWRDYEEYSKGFGSFEDGNFWIGNEYMHEVTNQSGQAYELMIVMMTMSNQRVVEKYDKFGLGNKADYYRLTLGQLTTSDIDNLAVNRNQPFGTNDKDMYSIRGGKVCGVVWKSGWWFDQSCSGDSGNLNVPYDPDQDQGYLKGIIWKGIPGNARIRMTSMQIRPQGFFLPTEAPPTTTPPDRSENIVHQSASNPRLLLSALAWVLLPVLLS